MSKKGLNNYIRLKRLSMKLEGLVKTHLKTPFPYLTIRSKTKKLYHIRVDNSGEKFELIQISPVGFFTESQLIGLVFENIESDVKNESS